MDTQEIHFTFTKELYETGEEKVLKEISCA